jgi:hypothetical protein
MKKWLWVFLFISNLFSIYYDRIIVIDISGSMKKGGLSEKVKAACKEYLQKVQIGERVIIMTFGNDVDPAFADKEIKGLKDIEELQWKIKQLSFNDNYTWMTKAFDVIASKLRTLQEESPERPKYVVIFTDGINEPPPGYEKVFTFEEIIEKYFKEFIRENTFIYVITLGVQPQRELREMEEKGMIKIVEQTPEKPPLQVVELSPEKFVFETELKEKIEGTFKLYVEKIEGIKEVPLFFEIHKESLNINISPDTFIVTNKNQVIEFNYTVDSIKNEGIFKFSLEPKTNIKGILVHPSRINFEIKLRRIVRIVEMELKNFIFESNIKDTIRFESEIYVKNLVNLEEAPIALRKESPVPKLNILVEPSNFLIKNKDQKIHLKFKLTGIEQPGNYTFFLLPYTDIKNVSISPDKFVFKINIKKPFVVPLWFWILSVFFLFLIFCGFLLSLKCKEVRWPENYYVAYKMNNNEISCYELRLYQKFCKNVITSKDLGIYDVDFKLKYRRGGRVFKYDEVEKRWVEIQNGQQIINNYYFEIK